MILIYKMLRRFIPLVFLATTLCGLVYLSVQQLLRQGANDPQIQMAEDAASQFETGTPTIGSLVPPGPVDISQSLAPYVVIYDASGHPTAGNGMLNGLLPNLPAGVFTYTASHGEDRLTWQPKPGIRQAIVLVSTANGGFVMAGRSLREVEVREDQVEQEAAVVWFASIVGLLILEILFAVIETQFKRRRHS